MPCCAVVFTLHEDAPAEWVDAWKTMVESITSRKHDEAWKEIHKAISRRVKARLALHKNDAKILLRWEGGFGGDVNDFDRQIRFDGCSKAMLVMSPIDGSIELPPGHPEAADHKREWTIPDLIEFKYAAAMGLNECIYAAANPGAPTGTLCIHAEISFSGLGVSALGSPEEENSLIDRWVNKKAKSAPPKKDEEDAPVLSKDQLLWNDFDKKGYKFDPAAEYDAWTTLDHFAETFESHCPEPIRTANPSASKKRWLMQKVREKQQEDFPGQKLWKRNAKRKKDIIDGKPTNPTLIAATKKH